MMFVTVEATRDKYPYFITTYLKAKDTTNFWSINETTGVTVLNGTSGDTIASR